MNTPTSAENISFARVAAEESKGTRPGITKLVVAIHGIGSQTRSDTVRSTARRFGARAKLPILPLGYFHIGNVGPVRFSRLDAPSSEPLSQVGFVEVFWADIPRRLVAAADTLEETKAWGRSVVSRAQAAYVKNVGGGGALAQKDFDVGIGVIEEIIEAIAVLENLCFLADKAGIFKFDVAALLRDYVDDVQVVTEFAQYREEIVFRFHHGLANLVADFTAETGVEPEVYVVAHSEGTAVGFLAMLQALSSRSVPNPIFDPDKPESARTNPKTVRTDWITRVRGFMTIGSPIDKHLLLWPKLWTELLPRATVAKDESVLIGSAVEGEAPRTSQQRIKWRNYYDLGDPVGFRLETAREYLIEKECAAFEFQDEHDVGFSRYRFPGKAHVDYWGDAAVFEHFIDEVVIPPTSHPPAEKPGDKPVNAAIGLVTPYVLTFLLHLGAVFALYKGIGSLLGDTTSLFKRDIVVLAVLLMGVSVSARLPRLTKTRAETWRLRWPALSAVVLLGAILLCYFCLSKDSVRYVGGAFVDTRLHPGEAEALGRVMLIVAALLIAVTGWLTPRKSRIGRRALLGVGCAIVAIVVLSQLAIVPKVKEFWPTLLGFAGFLYLWWMAILLFDLTFVWHRYICRNVAIETVDEWTRGYDAPSNGGLMFGKRPPPRPAVEKRWRTEAEERAEAERKSEPNGNLEKSPAARAADIGALD